MKSLHCIGVIARACFAGRVLAIWVVAVMACATCLPGLWGQNFTGCTGSPGNICAPSGTVVGIGTQNPNTAASLSVTGMTWLSTGGSSTWMWSDGGTYFQLGTGAQVGVQSIPAGLAFRFVVKESGNVGIGTSNPQSLLAVNGTITTKEVVVTNTGWSDYVFEPDYHLTPLNEVAAYVKEHHHLPEIPSAVEVKENGISLGDMQARLLAKIEELTLHLIQSDEKNRELQDRIARLENGRPPSTVAGPAGKETERP